MKMYFNEYFTAFYIASMLLMLYEAISGIIEIKKADKELQILFGE